MRIISQVIRTAVYSLPSLNNIEECALPLIPTSSGPECALPTHSSPSVFMKTDILARRRISPLSE